MYNSLEIIAQHIADNKTILFVGIGNVLKTDDGVGVYVTNRIKQHRYFKTLTVETGIENHVGKINTIKPDLLILVDCADIRKPPGGYSLLQINELIDHTTNTHNISLKNISLLFQADTWMLGIQPKDLQFGEQISPIVKASANKLIKQLNQLGSD